MRKATFRLLQILFRELWNFSQVENIYGNQHFFSHVVLKSYFFKTAILHATPAGLRLYEKLGFQKFGEMKQFLFMWKSKDFLEKIESKTLFNWKLQFFIEKEAVT